MKPILKDFTEVCRKSINRGIKQLLAEPDSRRLVVRIRWSFDEDWSGDNAVFFRVVLTDQAAPELNMAEAGYRKLKHLEESVRKHCQLERFVLNVYFNFRSESEQKSLREPEWE